MGNRPKKIIKAACVTLAAVLLLPLVACKGTPSSRIDGYLTCTTPQYLMGRDIRFSYEKSQLEEALEMQKSLLSEVEKGEKNYLFLALDLRKYVRLVNDIAENYPYAEILKYTSEDTEYYAKSIAVKADVGELLVGHKKLEIAFSKSEYRNQYFLGWTEEEIDEYIADLDPEEDAAFNAEREIFDSVVAKYSTKESTYFDIYEEFMAQSKQLAAIKGYDNYLDYVNAETYQREYDVAATEKIVEYVKEYIVPAYHALNESITFENITVEDYGVYASMVSGFMGPFKEYFDEYAYYMGGSFWRHYRGLWRKGDYFFADNDRTDTTAFCWSYSNGTPFLLFSKNYQDIQTFSHEFGHYNAFFDTAAAPTDIAEIYSHSDEILFGEYIGEYALISKGTQEVYMNNVLRGILNNILQTTIVWSTQVYAFTAEDATAGTVLAHALNMFTDFGYENVAIESVMDYIGYYLYENPGYPISYVNSCFSSLGIYGEYKKNGLDSAKEKYFSALAAYDEDVTYTELIKSVGLFDPFEEADYITVLELFN